MRTYKRVVFILVTILLGFTSYAQISTSSPYSRYGLGDLQSNVIAEYAAMGGGSTALNQATYINPYNPASYTKFPEKSFLFSTGLSHLTTSMETTNITQVTNNTSLSHIMLGFPISEKIGVSAGFLPYSNVGYNLSARDHLYNANMLYNGDGGISKVYFGGAIEVIERLSIGINASYLFGRLNRRKKIEFDDQAIFNTRSNSSINLKGYYYEIGLIYEYEQEDNYFTFGLTTNNHNPEINAKRTILTETFKYSGIIEVVKDTTVNETELGYANLPKYLSLGVSLQRGDNLLFVFDYSMQSWSEYRLFNESDSLENTMRISTGIQFTPDPSPFANYFKRIRYRFGVSLSNSPLGFIKESVGHVLPYEEKSITFGLGLPMKNNANRYNVFVELGQRGTTNYSSQVRTNLVKENYIRMGLSITFMGSWFNKKVYD